MNLVLNSIRFLWTFHWQEYKCKSVLGNAMQISNQFKFLQKKFQRGLFFSDFTDLNGKNLLSLEYEIQSAIKSKSFSKAVSRRPVVVRIRINNNFERFFRSTCAITTSNCPSMASNISNRITRMSCCWL